MTDNVALSDVLTVRQVAALLGVSPGRVRWWIYVGRMRAIRSKPYLIHVKDAVLPERSNRGADVAGRPGTSISTVYRQRRKDKTK
jgi:excisionase family DNA binding protein